MKGQLGALNERPNEPMTCASQLPEWALEFIAAARDVHHGVVSLHKVAGQPDRIVTENSRKLRKSAG